LQVRLNKEEDDFLHRFYALYKINLYNHHVLLSALTRNAGSNYSFHERMVVFLAYSVFVMALEAMFYGVEQQTV
jgi:hypothetical protein